MTIAGVLACYGTAPANSYATDLRIHAQRHSLITAAVIIVGASH